MHDEGGVVVSVNDERVSRYNGIFEGSAFFQRTDSSMRNFSPGNFEQIFLPTKSLMGQEKSLKCAFTLARRLVARISFRGSAHLEISTEHFNRSLVRPRACGMCEKLVMFFAQYLLKTQI